MQSLWNDQEAALCTTDLEERVYSSRLLGRELSLVRHGGGNTSVKVRETNLLGEEEDLLYVKGSGWDLATIEAVGFAPVRLAPLLQLARLERLSDPQMVEALQTSLARANAPSPSVESMLHAVLPYRYVDHTHADALLTLTNTPGGAERAREVFGDRVVILPYVMPGFEPAREVARRFPRERTAVTLGLVLLHHGLFSFGDTARESYERMIGLVCQAEEYLARKGALAPFPIPPAPPPSPARASIAALRADLSACAGRPLILQVTDSPKGWAFANRPEVGKIATRGPATPDHVIRTKAVPLIGRDLEGYAAAYRAYFTAFEPGSAERKTMLDPAPRVILDPHLGLCCAGGTAAEAAVVADLYDHTIDCILGAEMLGGWQALPPRDLFAMEYWDLEQAKLRRGGSPPPFQGEIALITGAASGIGRACVEAFLARGAAVVGVDRHPAVATVAAAPAYLGLVCDLTEEGALDAALEQGVRRFGGLDMLVLNAGVFPCGQAVAELSDQSWRQVLAVNLDANLALLRAAHPLLRQAPCRGRVVVMGSKNVPAPGPGAAAYSASKAALIQLMRVVALEWAADGIRLNALHPNAVFDTGLWTPEVLAARAAHYGLSVAEYKTNNLLRVEVRSRDVAELAAELCGPLFAKTTAAQIPIDGGNERVI